jgi:hypothetical protein
MAKEPLPEELGRFILTSIPSVPYLESILLLRREAATAWTSAQLARRLYLPEPQAAGLLSALQTAGIVAQSPAGPATFRYQPAPEVAGTLDRLAGMYISHLFEITNLIHSGVDRRAYQFADAFRFRKEP